MDNIFKPEIIVIDNNSQDKTLEIVRYFIQDPFLKNNKEKNYTKIKILKIDDYTPGKSLNLGVKECSNQNIMIISAHCELTNFDIKKHLTDLKKYSCIFGNQIPVFYGKKLPKDIYGVILVINLLKTTFQSMKIDTLSTTLYAYIKSKS